MATLVPLRHRTFAPAETGEIRLYTLGPASRVVEQGNGDRGIDLRIVEPSKAADTRPNAELLRYEPVRDWGRDWLAAAWSTGTNRARLEYAADIRTRSPLRLIGYVGYSGMDQVKYYDARQEQFVAHVAAEPPLLGGLKSRAGVTFKHVSSVADGGIIQAEQPYGAHGMSPGSGELALTLDTKTGVLTNRRGVAFQVNASHTPQAFSNDAAFTKLRAEASATTGAADRFAGDESVVGNAELRIPPGSYNAIAPTRYGVWGLLDVGRVFASGESSSRWHTGVGGRLWQALLVAGKDMQFAATSNAAVVRSDEATSFYISSGCGV